MPHRSAKDLGRKLVVAAAATAVLAAPVAAIQPEPQTPQAQVQPATGGRLLVLFFEFAGYTQPDLDRATAAATKFVQTQLKPADKVAVMVSRPDIRVLQDFTADRELLVTSIQQVSGLPVPESPDEPEATRLAALETAIKMLGVLPEKKALIYLSSGPSHAGDGQAQLQSTINTAIRANVALYPIDTRGLVNK